ncbi:hypothetical protein [Hafnia phage yong3]|nr:hypothetical protein [Hafnia phage yong3]
MANKLAMSYLSRCRRSKGRKTKHRLIGGPFDGLDAYLFTAGTLEFRVPSFDSRKGRYNRDNVWEFTQ